MKWGQIAPAVLLVGLNWTAAAWAGDQVMTIDSAAMGSMGIRTAVAVGGALNGHITCPAYIEADPRKVVRIRPIGQGRVRSVAVYRGQTVKAGQILLEYDDYQLEQVRQQVRSAEAGLEEARAARDEAALAAQRGKLLGGGALARGEVQRREMVLRHADGLIREKSAILDGYRLRLKNFSSSTERAVDGVSQVISPIDGIVRAINTAMGEAAVSGTLPLVEIVDLQSVWVVSQVLEHDAQRLSTGAEQKTMLTGAASGGIRSRIDSIDGQVDPQTRQLLVRSLVPNPNGILRPGTLVSTEIQASKPVSGVVIPASAVQQIADANAVFVRVSRDHYVARMVETGPEEAGKIVITHGISVGDEVVTQGSFALKSQLAQAKPDDGS